MTQKSDLHEDAFWNTPASRLAPTPKSGSMIMDESFDVDNVTASFDSPLAHRTPSARHGQPSGGFLRMGALGAPEDASDDGDETARFSSEEVNDEPAPDEEEEETEDATVVLSKPPPPEPEDSSAAPDASSSLIEIEPTEPLPAAIQQTLSKSHVRVTSELERIVVCRSHPHPTRHRLTS